MKLLETPRQIDPVLLPFLRETDEARAQALLAEIISNHAEPLIDEVIRHKLRAFADRPGRNPQSQDAGDIRHEILVQLLTRLRECKASPEEKAIESFRGYVAVVTYHICYQYLREQHPERRRLSQRLRYCLSRGRGLAIWEAEGQRWLCGLAAWRGQAGPAATPWRLQELRDAPERAGLGRVDLPRLELPDLLPMIFAWAGAPVELRHLVTLVADLQGIKDLSSVNGSEAPEAGDRLGRVHDPRASHAARVEQQLYLKQLWREICGLPLPQRTALLLNLRDAEERGLIVLLADLRIATIRQLAEALAFPPEEFARLWDQLPLDDARIGSLLGLARQQVINLRRAARRNLAQRMKNLAAGPSNKFR